MLRKHDLLTRREAAFFMEERESLVLGRHSEWLTRLYASFQDELNLYLLMEYVPGGSLKNLMDSQEEPMEEDSARFYAAEMVLAIEEVHRLGFIHR
jgi:serine/threonine protein kinase